MPQTVVSIFQGFDGVNRFPPLRHRGCWRDAGNPIGDEH
jgi:hypothetical protein